MTTSLVSSNHTRVQKVCTLWTHDENFARADVVFNQDKFPELNLSPGALIQIIALKQAPVGRDFQDGGKNPPNNGKLGEAEEASPDGHRDNLSRRSRRSSMRIMLDENGVEIPGGRDLDAEKSYIFVAKPMPTELKSRHPGLQISVAEKVAKVFGFRNRVQVVVMEADEESHSASHVEITFRDEYLARADMWRMSISELSNRTVYRGQKLLFIGTIKASIKNVYIDGKSTHSGYFSAMTKPIFRSESARFVLFIQMSKEMWDFDSEGAGEIMFNKVVNGFLPDLFKRWMKINARHLVTIILFTRMTYDEAPSKDTRSQRADAGGPDESFNPSRDYYRVVVSDMASGDWIRILYQLKKEFRAFLRDVSLVPRHPTHSVEATGKSIRADDADLVISGRPSTASQGNILEAINLAAAQFAKDYIDRDLVRTGISVVIITPGSGVFEVDYNMLKLTTDTLIGSGIGIDLVCLSPMPLHSVPLFKYKKPRTMSDVKEDALRSEKRHNAAMSFPNQDEETPRQYEPQVGLTSQGSHEPQRTILSPAVNISHDNADDWRYAMPHWLDISFWSGPSDEIMELMKPAKSLKPTTKTHKKASAFALRCRMYELQMMGVMENELGAISIPYMEEASTYPHHERELQGPLQPRYGNPLKGTNAIVSSYSLKEKADADERHEEMRQLYTSWMDDYDDNVFSSPAAKTPRDGTPALIAPVNIPEMQGNLQSDSRGRDNYLSTSFKSIATTVRRSARPSPDSGLSQLSREVSHDPESPRGSTYRTEDSPLPRADVLYRQQRSNNIQLPKRSEYSYERNSGPSADLQESCHAPHDSAVVSKGNSPPRNIGPPTMSSLQSPSTRTPASTKPWFLRNLSFGGFMGGPAKATSSVSALEAAGTQGKPAKDGLATHKGAIAEKLASTRLPEPYSKDREQQGREKQRSSESQQKIPSQPIAIKPGTRHPNPSAELPFSNRSVETVKGPKFSHLSESSHRGSFTKDPGSTFLFAGSQAVTKSIGQKLDLKSGGGTKVPCTLSPTSAIAPWAILVNPCNPRKNKPNVVSQFRRWQHVFPKQLKTSSVKWKSLCSPAAVPLTNEYFPTAEQLANEYNESPYKIAQNEDDDVLEAPKSRESLIRELIAFRLSHGFQIIVGPAVAEVTGGREQDLSNILHTEYMCHDGDTVFMCVGNTIHQLVCVAGGEVEVKRFSRKPTTALESSAGIDKPFTYKPLIRTAFEDKYQSREIILRPARKEFNWNFIDTFLAGYHDEFSETLRFWRARFVLIPVDIPHVHRRALPVLTEDSEEEIRLEGIRKLTQLWQRHRYIPPEERQSQAINAKKQKDPNPLAIEYHTRDPSAIVAVGPDNPLLHALENDCQASLFSETDQYHTSNIDIKRLAEDLQGEKGIPMLDRRWHWRLHYNCFLGFDLTSWLLSNFRDIETRDEAVDLGNKLMEKGLFHHVQRRHQFRDGNFFFQIAAEYRAPRPDTKAGWFGMKKADRSVPSTPLTENPRGSPLLGRGSLKSRHSVDNSSVSSISEGEKTSTRDHTPKRKVTLSRVMRYDVDARKRSYRPELISLHYDRLHNPDNCYHVRIDWMNVTAKLIEDAIVTWATSVEKYGLKLVEVPIAEASNIIDHHPFRSPYIIKLALQPPQTLPDQLWDSSHFSPQAKADRFVYHKALLRKMNYVLDMEAASAFPSDVDVSYSWGKPKYKYTQFIHRTGGVLAQITDEGDFLLLANRLAHNRAKDTTKFRPTDPYEHKRTTATPTNPPTPAIDKVLKSPFSSPLARPVQDSSLLHTAPQTATLQTPRPDFSSMIMNQSPEQIKDDLEAFCSDPVLLRQFYEQALQRTPGVSPRMPPVPESSIPSLGLPPAISIREASPATSGGWAGLGIGAVATPRIETATMMARRQAYEGLTGTGGMAGIGSIPGAANSGNSHTSVKRGSVESSASSRRRGSQSSARSGSEASGA